MADPLLSNSVASLAATAFPGRVQAGDSARDLHARDEGHLPPCRPLAVFLPRTVEESAGMVRFCARHDLGIVPFGAGSGQEGHFALLVDPDDPRECATADDFNTWLAEEAIALGGSVSGEHGIGLGKRHLMEREHGPALPMMRAIKMALDPRGLFNPGKLLP